MYQDPTALYLPRRPEHEVPGRRVFHLYPTERIVLFLAGITFAVSGLTLLWRANAQALVAIPKDGGMHTEGVIGSPRFINPVLATSETDLDLTSLTYAGLLARRPDGELEPELAESYMISEDGTEYTFTLRKGLTFHDGAPLTANDVAYTIQVIQEPTVKSPRFPNWDGVNVEVVDEHTIRFTLQEPFAPFIENTTVGIIPRHIWGALSPDEFPHSQYNVTPVGAGPYAFEEVMRDTGGIPSLYELRSFDEYALGKPHIRTLAFRLAKNQAELMGYFRRGEVDAIHGVTPAELEDLSSRGAMHVLRVPLMRTYAVFFNHNRSPVLLHDEVRQALDMAAPKERLVEAIFKGYATALSGPLPPSIAPRATEQPQPEARIDTARSILEEAGWERPAEGGPYAKEGKDGVETLRMSLATANTPDLAASAEAVAAAWRELGAEVEVKLFEPSDLTQNIIRPRRYEALLFGLVTGTELDLYAFWHSSQRNDPGLNIAQFADIDTDGILEKARAETDPAKRLEHTVQVAQRIESRTPAAFLYSPDFLYVTNGRTQNITLRHVTDASDRFAGVELWHVETDRVWPFVQRLLDWKG